MLGHELIGIVQRILQESRDPETVVSSLLAAFTSKTTTAGQAAEVPARSSSAAKFLSELFAYLPTEDGGEGAGEIAFYYKDIATVQQTTA